MSKILEYLLTQDVDTQETREVDITGFPYPFVIRSLTAKEDIECRRKATKKTKQGQQTDGELYMLNLVVASLVEPNPKNAELQAKYGSQGDANETVCNMLRGGQYLQLLKEVQDINGMNDTVESLATEALD